MDGIIQCVTAFGVPNVLSNFKDGEETAASCPNQAEAIGYSLTAFRGPGSSVDATVECVGAGFYGHPDDCDTLAADLNDMAEMFRRGGFQECVITTPTTTATSTTPTTTQFEAAFACAQDTRADILNSVYVEAHQSCDVQVAALNDLLRTCSAPTGKNIEENRRRATVLGDTIRTAAGVSVLEGLPLHICTSATCQPQPLPRPVLSSVHTPPFERSTYASLLTSFVVCVVCFECVLKS